MPWPTHAVTNQVPELQDYNLFTTDAALADALAQNGAGWHAGRLQGLGAELGSAAMLELGDLANRHPPELHTHDRVGNRIDAVEFHPSWHQLLASLRREGLHASPFIAPGPGAQAARAAGYFLHAQVEAGSLCPTTMTHASIPVLAAEPALFATCLSRKRRRCWSAWA